MLISLSSLPLFCIFVLHVLKWEKDPEKKPDSKIVLLILVYTLGSKLYTDIDWIAFRNYWDTFIDLEY